MLALRVFDGKAYSDWDTVTVTVAYPEPIISFWAYPAIMAPGGATTLLWTTHNASYGVRIDPIIGNVDISGSKRISLTDTTTFTITASGPGGTVQATATVIVDENLPSVEIAVSPETIQAGETATLTWSSTKADALSINEGIGAVSPNGSITVSPNKTTTYTITAAGPGGTAVDSVTLIVIHPEPTVSLSADPIEIHSGESTTLTWTSTDAVSAAISPGIGAVDPSGSITITPAQTTEYTITVTGLGGTAESRVTVAVVAPAPSVSISAVPESIKVGQTANLSWNTTNATSCEIDQGIGTVALSGSVEVTPTETTVYTITATGPGGTNTASVTVDVDNPFTINIISPADMSAVNRPDVLVYGTITNAWGNETAVTVNGVFGLVSGNQFAANHVQLLDGENTITVTATDDEGNQYSKSITVYANTEVDYVRLDASEQEGVPVLESDLTVSGNVEIDTFSLSCQCPAQVDFPAQTDESVTASFSTPGLYIFTVEAQDTQGYTYTDSVAVSVWDFNEMDAMFRNKWGKLKQALTLGDVAAAVSCHKEQTRAGYEDIYTVLHDRLLSIVQEMGPITPVYIDSYRAEYIIDRNDLIDGQTVTLTFSIYFSRDENGIWWLERY